MSVHDHDPLCRPPRMFTQHGCADCNLIREVRENERLRVIDEAMNAIRGDYRGTPTLGVQKAIRRIEELLDSPPADPAEGTGSAGRGQEAS